METSEKVRENLARRRLARRGYQSQKSRARDPHDLTFGGYQIVDSQYGGVAAGWGNADRGLSLSLKGVEDWLDSDEWIRAPPEYRTGEPPTRPGDTVRRRPQP
jgi:hypothetical protein